MSVYRFCLIAWVFCWVLCNFCVSQDLVPDDPDYDNGTPLGLLLNRGEHAKLQSGTYWMKTPAVTGRGVHWSLSGVHGGQGYNPKATVISAHEDFEGDALIVVGDPDIGRLPDGKKLRRKAVLNFIERICFEDSSFANGDRRLIGVHGRTGQQFEVRECTLFGFDIGVRFYLKEGDNASNGFSTSGIDRCYFLKCDTGAQFRKEDSGVWLTHYVTRSVFANVKTGINATFGAIKIEGNRIENFHEYGIDLYKTKGEIGHNYFETHNQAVLIRARDNTDMSRTGYVHTFTDGDVHFEFDETSNVTPWLDHQGNPIRTVFHSVPSSVGE